MSGFGGCLKFDTVAPLRGSTARCARSIHTRLLHIHPQVQKSRPGFIPMDFLHDVEFIYLFLLSF